MHYTTARKIYIAISAVLLAVVLGIVFWLSHQSAGQSTQTSTGLMNYIIGLFGQAPSEAVIRTIAHFLEFGAVGFLVINMYFALKDKLNLLLCIGLSWAYAWTDEIHQIFVPGRTFQISDLLVDLCGIVLGTVAYVICVWVYGRLVCKMD